MPTELERLRINSALDAELTGWEDLKYMAWRKRCEHLLSQSPLTLTKLELRWQSNHLSNSRTFSMRAK